MFLKTQKEGRLAEFLLLPCPSVAPKHPTLPACLPEPQEYVEQNHIVGQFQGFPARMSLVWVSVGQVVATPPDLPQMAGLGFWGSGFMWVDVKMLILLGYPKYWVPYCNRDQKRDDHFDNHPCGA